MEHIGNAQVYVIEDGIPIPPLEHKGNAKGWRNNFPLDELEVGQSIMFYFPQPYTFRQCNAIEHAVSRACGRTYRKEGRRFERRTYDEGIRVWRME